MTAKIDDSLSITAKEENVSLGILSSASINTGNTTVTVKATGDGKTYNLYVKSIDTENTGLYLNGNADEAGNNVIPAKAGLTAGTTGWGVQDKDGAWQAVPAYTEDGVLLRSKGTADTEDGEETEVTFGASIASGHSLTTGDYSNKVVFIAAVTD